jgi:NAD(P)-dependent dehydrogenase (short-subunit alcohol dehydrogenase family)
MRIEDLFNVSGRVALVTGGSRGIGRMIAHGLVANGVRVYISARKVEELQATADELSELGECIALPADLSNSDEVTRLAAEVADREPRLDILVNNAGASWGASLGEFPAHAFDRVLTVNVQAPFLLTQALLPQLRAAADEDQPARVINIGSVDGIRVPPLGNYSYSASKAGIHMITRHLAHHLKDDHITVNAIAPGPFESKMMAFLLDNDEGRQAVASTVPMGRIGTPEDMAGAVLYLASRAGAYLTGAVIPVDGGISTHG